MSLLFKGLISTPLFYNVTDCKSLAIEECHVAYLCIWMLMQGYEFPAIYTFEIDSIAVYQIYIYLFHILNKYWCATSSHRVPFLTSALKRQHIWNNIMKIDVTMHRRDMVLDGQYSLLLLWTSLLEISHWYFDSITMMKSDWGQ